jgi:catechol 2,3-dioxygenase-like lactoylglutathione lyase family enzyme
MISGAHLIVYSSDADADRVFFRDILGFPHVDVGRGWLIFRLPPAEVAVHPADGEHARQPGALAMLGAHLYLMCDDVQTEIKWLETKQVTCSPVEREPWGIRTTIKLPSGGEIGLYQPTHPTALKL